MTDKKTWAKCVAAWRASGESATVFAAREGYAASSLRLVVIPHGVEIYLGVEPIDLRWASTGSAAWSPIGSRDARQVEPIALEPDGQQWLENNRTRIELHRLPPYSPELNGIEGVWKVTKKRTTHNRFYRTVDDRDSALVDTFETFKAQPEMVAGHVARFL